MKVLTKSLFLKGFEGDKYLWICANNKDIIPSLSIMDQDKINSGIRIGDLAKSLFKDGIDLKEYIEDVSLIKTKELMKSNVLFEASFVFDNFLCKIDVIKPNGDGFDVFEVKSSSKIKQKHIEDLAFQRMVLEGNNVKIKNYFLVYVNSDYEFENNFDVNSFFEISNVTNKVLEKDVFFEAKRMLKVINSKVCPEFELDDLYKTEYGNFLTEEFKSNLDYDSVFNLHSITRKKAVELYKQGFEKMTNLPEDFELSSKQLIQIKSLGSQFVDKIKIKKFLEKLDHPLICLDFEAYQQIVPSFYKTGAYTQVPFQYSMHIKYEKELVHKEFLYEGEGDPRLDFILNLKKDLPDNGSVLVYYRPFEVGRLKELANVFPEHKDFIFEVISRIVDLRDPFGNFWFYDKKQKGSTSIKEVLKVFSDENHKNLDIGNGGEAMILYKNNKNSLDEKLRKDLLEYCKLDTYAMVVILNKLYELSK
jgi:hypothetical protein